MAVVSCQGLSVHLHLVDMKRNLEFIENNWQSKPRKMQDSGYDHSNQAL